MRHTNISHESCEIFERPVVVAHVYQAVFNELSHPGYDLNPFSFDSYTEYTVAHIMDRLDSCDPEYHFLRYEAYNAEWKLHDGVRLLFGDELSAVLAITPAIARQAASVLETTDSDRLDDTRPGQILWDMVDLWREARVDSVCSDCRDAENGNENHSH